MMTWFLLLTPRVSCSSQLTTTNGAEASATQKVKLRGYQRASVGSKRVSMEPQGCERRKWLNPQTRHERERISQSVLRRTCRRNLVTVIGLSRRLIEP